MAQLFQVTRPDEAGPMFALRIGEDRFFAFTEEGEAIISIERFDAEGFALTPVLGCEHLPVALDVAPPEGYAGPALVTSDGVPAVLLAPALIGIPGMERRMDRPPRPIFDVYGLESWTDRGRTVPYAGTDPPRGATVLARGPDGAISFAWPCGDVATAPRYGLWIAGGLVALALLRRK